MEFSLHYKIILFQSFYIHFIAGEDTEENQTSVMMVIFRAFAVSPLSEKRWITYHRNC